LKGLGREQEVTYLDRIAKLMLTPDENFDTLRELSPDIDFDFARTAEDMPSDLRPIPEQ
jgi:hypothetical protein